MEKLAVIIPAYKHEFFDKALQSLANQTNKSFNIYIGDDCSPFDLKSIVDKHTNQLNISYTRFTNNIGAKNLVHQWNRCVKLTKTERWLWLFSDDDIADANCVEVFFKTVEADNKQFDVYRFDTRVIDKDDRLIGNNPESPFVERSFDMALEILKFNRGNSMPDHIFSREVYEQFNGFVYTEYAQGADWATSILFSSIKGICTMNGAKVSWRLSDQNISGQASKKNEMLRGYLQFLIWTDKNFYNLKYKNTGCYKILQTNINLSLVQVIHRHYKKLSLYMFKEIFDYYKNKHTTINSFLLSLFLYATIKYQSLSAYLTRRYNIRLDLFKQFIKLQNFKKQNTG